MMKSLFLAAVILGVGCLLMFSQWSQAQTSREATESPQSAGGQESELPIAAAEKDAVTTHSLISVNSLQGATLMSKDDQPAGSVARIALTTTLQNVHLVVNVGGVLGIGAREIAVPLTAIRLRPSKEADDGSVWLSVNATREQLRKAPALEARDSLELTDLAWIQKNAQFYGIAPQPSQPEHQSADKLPVFTAEQLLGKPVIGEGDTATIASLSDILFGFQETAIEYAILSYGGTLGIGRKYVAIPFRQLKIHGRDNGEVEIVSPHNSKTLAEQQHVTPAEYPELKLRSVRLRIEQ